MSEARVIQFPHQPAPETKGGRVADCDDGYTRIANELLEAALCTELTVRQLKIVLAVIRKTYGFNKKTDRITNTQIAKMTGIHHTHICKAKNELLDRHILVMVGCEIGVNNVVSEWGNAVSQNSKTLAKSANKTLPKSANKTLAKSANKTLAKSANDGVPSQLNTKDTLKDNKDNTPISPEGDAQSAVAELPDTGDKKKSSPAKQPVINFQAFADSYNEILGDRLPICAVMSDKRKRALKKLLPLLKAPTLECFSAYLNAFAHTARPFYFGDNDRGWRASFDFVIRQDTLTATKEGSIADSRLEIEGDDA